MDEVGKNRSEHVGVIKMKRKRESKTFWNDADCHNSYNLKIMSSDLKLGFKSK